jgi:hypothetical protein
VCPAFGGGNYFYCAYSATQECLSPSASCVHNYDCCSGSCSGGHCAGCGSPGAGCSQGSDCCSGSCNVVMNSGGYMNCL